MSKIKRALISVFDKRNVVEFAKALAEMNIEIISSGGTAKLLSSNGIKVTDVSSFTGFPEMMGGRVKTLHPRVHGAILADRSKKEHLDEAKKQKIDLIDLVVVNLYPFEESISNNVELAEAVENIDIGGPALLRSAAKNYKSVACIVNPNRYSDIINKLKNTKKISEKTCEQLALEVWEHVAHYDVVISNYFRKTFKKDRELPTYLNLTFKKLQDLRYGENPHQMAAVYSDTHFEGPSILSAKQFQGKHLSYNNIQDASSAYELVKEFDQPTAVIVKHNNPSGVASSDDIIEAYKTARSVDPEAAFGGVVAINRPVTGELAKEIISVFVEIVLAPSFSDSAKEVFKTRRNLRVLEMPNFHAKRLPYKEYKTVAGGLLAQDADTLLLEKGMRFVTKRKPTKEEMQAMLYAWKIAKYVKSNAIVYARTTRAVGIGAGQMKRVDAAKLAAMIARDYSGEISLRGCAMASDAFFPFRDGIDYAAKLGITAIIQPGGSLKDEEVIKAADEHNIAMIFTGIRHFRH